MTDDGPRIRVTADGPYRVSGSPPLVRIAQVETEYGEPVDWRRRSRSPPGSDTRSAGAAGRARSRSATTPTEEGVRRDRGRRPRAACEPGETFAGDDIVMTDDLSICAQGRLLPGSLHDGLGVDRARPRTRRPGHGAAHGRALSRRGRLDRDDRPSGAEPVEPAFEPSIAVMRDGPLWVRGGIPVESADGFDVRGPQPGHALPLRSLVEQAVLRRLAQGRRVPRWLSRRESGSSPEGRSRWRARPSPAW